MHTGVYQIRSISPRAFARLLITIVSLSAISIAYGVSPVDRWLQGTWIAETNTEEACAHLYEEHKIRIDPISSDRLRQRSSVTGTAHHRLIRTFKGGLLCPIGTTEEQESHKVTVVIEGSRMTLESTRLKGDFIPLSEREILITEGDASLQFRKANSGIAAFSLH